MSSIKDTAAAFFDACGTGKGWAACAEYCHPGAWAMRQLGWSA